MPLPLALDVPPLQMPRLGELLNIMDVVSGLGAGPTAGAVSEHC
jgi:hypothetical protein